MPLQLICVVRQHLRSLTVGAPVMLLVVHLCCGLEPASVLQQSRLLQHVCPVPQHDLVEVSPHTFPGGQHSWDVCVGMQQTSGRGGPEQAQLVEHRAAHRVQACGLSCMAHAHVG